MMKIYSIKDNKGDFNSQLLTFPNDGQAKRAVPYIVQNNELMKRYPQDFTLYAVGEFDFESGHIKPYETVMFCCNLSEGDENADLA